VLFAGFEMSFAFGDHEEGVLDHVSIVLIRVFGWHWMTEIGPTKVLLKPLIVRGALINQSLGVLNHAFFDLIL